jgi:Protein of unknown function (DUF2752)
MPHEGKPRSSWVRAALSDTFLRLCLVFTIAFILMPPEGIGYEMCASKRLFNAPCPGCGMTRCGSNLVRGNVVRAFQYHAFGMVAIPICAVLGITALLPRRWRDGLRSRLSPHEAWLSPLVKVAVSLFFAYGIVRLGLVVLGRMAFPTSWPE